MLPGEAATSTGGSIPSRDGPLARMRTPTPVAFLSRFVCQRSPPSVSQLNAGISARLGSGSACNTAAEFMAGESPRANLPVKLHAPTPAPQAIRNSRREVSIDFIVQPLFQLV